MIYFKNILTYYNKVCLVKTLEVLQELFRADPELDCPFPFHSQSQVLLYRIMNSVSL